LLDDINLDDINNPNSLGAIANELKKYYELVKNYDKAYGTNYLKDVFPKLEKAFKDKDIERFRQREGLTTSTQGTHGGSQFSLPTWYKIESYEPDALEGRYIHYVKLSGGVPYHDKINEQDIKIEVDIPFEIGYKKDGNKYEFLVPHALSKDLLNSNLRELVLWGLEKYGDKNKDIEYKITYI
jgi:hypothetical protein